MRKSRTNQAEGAQPIGTIKVSQIPGAGVCTVDIFEGATVGDVIGTLPEKFQAQGYQTFLNGQPCDRKAAVKDKDTIGLHQKVQSAQ